MFSQVGSLDIYGLFTEFSLSFFLCSAHFVCRKDEKPAIEEEEEEEEEDEEVENQGDKETSKNDDGPASKRRARKVRIQLEDLASDDEKEKEAEDDYEDEESNEDSSSDESFDEPKRKRPKRQSPDSTKKKAKTETNEEETDLDPEDRTCPHCRKTFGSFGGLKYHVGAYIHHAVFILPTRLLFSCFSMCYC